jgi:hypothetical protein
VDETFVGGLDPNPKGRRQMKKVIVAIAVEVYRPGKGYGRCRLEVAPTPPGPPWRTSSAGTASRARPS